MLLSYSNQSYSYMKLWNLLNDKWECNDFFLKYTLYFASLDSITYNYYMYVSKVLSSNNRFNLEEIIIRNKYFNTKVD